MTNAVAILLFFSNLLESTTQPKGEPNVGPSAAALMKKAYSSETWSHLSYGGAARDPRLARGWDLRTAQNLCSEIPGFTCRCVGPTSGAHAEQPLLRIPFQWQRDRQQLLPGQRFRLGAICNRLNDSWTQPGEPE